MGPSRDPYPCVCYFTLRMKFPAWNEVYWVAAAAILWIMCRGRTLGPILAVVLDRAPSRRGRHVDILQILLHRQNLLGRNFYYGNFRVSRWFSKSTRNNLVKVNIELLPRLGVRIVGHFIAQAVQANKLTVDHHYTGWQVRFETKFCWLWFECSDVSLLLLGQQQIWQKWQGKCTTWWNSQIKSNKI